MAHDAPSLRELLRVAPGSSVHLADLDPAATHGFDKAGSAAVLAADLARLGDLQLRLWAEARRGLLIVLQGIDTAGKGGTISHVMSGFNPQGCLLRAFKVPTPEEAAHDFLWRVHPWVPGAGGISIFDRSYYEQVLVVRVAGLEPEKTWRRHYAEINSFERLLVDGGTMILKFCLFIDKDEQRRRLQARLDEPDKRWKWRMSDLDTRAHWDEYLAAYDELLGRCSTDIAPWYLVPANHKWFRNLAVGRIVAETLEAMDPRFPPPVEPVPPGFRVT